MHSALYFHKIYIDRKIEQVDLTALTFLLSLVNISAVQQTKPTADEIHVKATPSAARRVSPTTWFVKGQYSESSASVFIVSCRDVLSSEADARQPPPGSELLAAAVCSAAQFW